MSRGGDVGEGRGSEPAGSDGRARPVECRSTMPRRIFVAVHHTTLHRTVDTLSSPLPPDTAVCSYTQNRILFTHA